MFTVAQLIANPCRAFPQDTWETTRPAPRVVRLKERLLRTERQVDVERARYATESYRQTEGQPMPIRRAKMLLHLVRSMSIAIHPGELIVGNRSVLPRMGVIAPEGAVEWVDRELEDLPTRPQDRFNVEQDQIRELRQRVFPYWRGRALEDVVAARIPADVQRMVEGKVFGLNQTDHAQGHILPDVEGWLCLGIEGIRRKVAVARRAKGEKLVPQKEAFYQAAEIALQAAQAFIARYADLAGERVGRTHDATRREELAHIAESCAWLSLHPPRDFWEALQATWFLFCLLQIESNASSFSPGRLDQVLLKVARKIGPCSTQVFTTPLCDSRSAAIGSPSPLIHG